MDKKIIDFFKGSEIAAEVYTNKYAIRKGNTVEPPEKAIQRVAKAVASVENDPEYWQKKFEELMEGFNKFVPAGRILYGAGRENVKVSLFNCLFIPIKEDSIEGIFETAKQLAKAYSRGFGVGIDISILRYKGAPVNNAAEKTTGSVSFMDLYSLVTGTIGQNQRRGANLISIDCSHPDVFDFIDKKAVPDFNTQELIRDFEYAGFPKDLIKDISKVLVRQQVRFANISVKLSDEFIKVKVIIAMPPFKNGLFNPDSLKIIEGYAEKNLKNVKNGEIVQFERFGFVKIEKNGSIVGILTHK